MLCSTFVQINNTLEEGLSNSNAALIITGHKEFTNIDPSLFADKLKNPILIDTRGIIDPETAKKTGLVFRGLGRGE